MRAKAEPILVATSDAVVAASVLDTFLDVEKNYFLRSWKSSELDAGHFVESVRRFIDFRLFGSYTRIGKPLANFNDIELKRLGSATGSDSYRIHIPRALLYVYGLRNKRGVGHLGTVRPNYMDATVIVSVCKWILAELLRLESTLSSNETSTLVDQIVDRPIPGVWNAGTITRVLKSNLGLKKQALFLLLNQSPLTLNQLAESTDSKDTTQLKYLRKILRELHDQRLIEFATDSSCTLSPTGQVEAEAIALALNDN